MRLLKDKIHNNTYFLIKLYYQHIVNSNLNFKASKTNTFMRFFTFILFCTIINLIAAQTENLGENSFYKIQSLESNKYLTHGAKNVIISDEKKDILSNWKFEEKSNGYGQLINENGQVLGYEKTKDNMAFLFVNNNKNDSKLWRMDSIGLNKVTIVDKSTGYALDIMDDKDNQGAYTIIYKRHNKANQKWIINKKENGYFTLTSVSANRLLAITPKTDDNGAQVTQWASPKKGMLWKFKHVNDSTYNILSANGKLALQFGNGIVNDTITAEMWAINGSDKQNWKLSKKGNNTYIIYDYTGKRCLDLMLSVKGNGTPIISYVPNGGDNQYWKLIPKK